MSVNPKQVAGNLLYGNAQQAPVEPHPQHVQPAIPQPQPVIRQPNQVPPLHIPVQHVQPAPSVQSHDGATTNPPYQQPAPAPQHVSPVTQPIHVPAQTATVPVQPTVVLNEPAVSELDFITAQRDVEEFDRARRHSGRVKYLKILLPVVGVLVIAGFAAAMVLRNTDLPDLNIGSLSLDNGNLVMENPVLNGTDAKQRPYNLTAAKAVQNVDNPSVVKLDQINAKLPMEEGDFANITAGIGEYDSKAKTLQLGGDVVVTTESGMEIQLKDADLDLDKGSIFTDSAVSMNSKEASITSQSLKVEKNGDLIVFDRKVRMTLYPSSMPNAAASGN